MMSVSVKRSGGEIEAPLTGSENNGRRGSIEEEGNTNHLTYWWWFDTIISNRINDGFVGDKKGRLDWWKVKRMWRKSSLTCRSWWWVGWGQKRWKRDNPTIAKCRRRKGPAANVRPICKRWTKALIWARWRNRPLPNWTGNNWKWSAAVCRSWRRSWPCNCRPRWANWGSRPRWRSAPFQDKSKAAQNRLRLRLGRNRWCCWTRRRPTTTVPDWKAVPAMSRHRPSLRRPSCWPANHLDWPSRIGDWPPRPSRPFAPSAKKLLILNGQRRPLHCWPPMPNWPTWMPFDWSVLTRSWLFI